MSAFRDRPAFLYAAVTLLVSYMLLTLVSAASLPLEIRQAQSLSYLKHIGLVILNICFLFSKNRAMSYFAFAVLAVLPFEMYAQMFALASSRGAFWAVLTSIDGMRLVLWSIAIVLLGAKLLVDRCAAPRVSHEQST